VVLSQGRVLPDVVDAVGDQLQALGRRRCPRRRKQPRRGGSR
jgi:hypothetical protein